MRDLQATLARMAEEHLAQMGCVPWDALAKSIRARASATTGETFGCGAEGVYVDLGDNARWIDEIGGDILLTAHAAAPDQVDGARVERSMLIPRPKTS